MDAAELKRMAGKIVAEKRQTAKRFKQAYGWPVLRALAAFYYANGDGVSVAFVAGTNEERTAGGLSAAVSVGDLAADKEHFISSAPQDAPPPSATTSPDSPADGGELIAMAGRIVDHGLTETQRRCLISLDRNDEMSSYKPPTFEALRRKDLLEDEGDYLTPLGRAVVAILKAREEACPSP
jgi:hypothetical protein